MAKKADAWQEYKEAALVDMMLKVSCRLMLSFSRETTYIDSCNGLITEHSLTAVTSDSKRDQIG